MNYWTSEKRARNYVNGDGWLTSTPAPDTFTVHHSL